MATTLLAALPAGALADGPGVLLSGYAPPGAGEEAILGTTAPTPRTGAKKLAPAAAPTGMPLAQPVAITRPTALRSGAGRDTSHRGGGSHHSSPARQTASRPAAVVSSASPDIVAAASRAPSGLGFGISETLIGVAIAGLIFGLALAWRRPGN